MSSVRVLTFNVWDIPVAAHRSARVAGLCKVLARNADDLDVVGLLECWMEDDRDALIAAGKAGGLAHHVFFRNGCGFPGGQSSGLVVLSRWPIESSAYHRFSCAGKAHKLLHWDYSLYSGKGIGVAHIRGPAEVGPIDLFVSHFVAYYTPTPESAAHDEYVHHRRLGAWEAAQFMRRTQRRGSLAVCCVDLNADPESLTYRAMRRVSGLGDAWGEAGRARKGVLPDALWETEQAGLTCNYAGNCYFENNAWIASGEPSARVDYILFRAPEDGRLSLDWCERRFSGVDDTDATVVSLSDHAAVLASFRVHGEEEDQPSCVETRETVCRGERTMSSTSSVSVAAAAAAAPEQLHRTLVELQESAQLGVACARKRSRSAVTKAYVAALLAFCSLAVPHALGLDSTWTRVLLEFVLCAGLAWTANALFVLGNITVPDEASAMMFMHSSVTLERAALEHKHQDLLLLPAAAAAAAAAGAKAGARADSTACAKEKAC